MTRFNDEASLFEKFAIGGYAATGGEVSANAAGAPSLPYLEFDPLGQPVGRVTEPGMDLSSLDPGQASGSRCTTGSIRTGGV